MKMNLKDLGYYLCFFLFGIILILLLFSGSQITLPDYLQVFGRMHPMLLHFPIVLIIITVIWEISFAGKSDSFIRDTGDWLLIGTTTTTLLTVLFGFFLSYEESYSASAISSHKFYGVFVAFLLFFWLNFRRYARQQKLVRVTFGLLSIVFITITAHLGAEITHGKNFVFQPVSANNEQVEIEEMQPFTHLVLPILKNKCSSCHGDKKTKGELSFSTIEEIQKGGKNGALWEQEKEKPGLMMTRILLPEDHKEHMAPKGKPQLTQEEINLIRLWIKSGANFEQKFQELAEDDSLKLHILKYFTPKHENEFKLKAVSDQLIKDLTTDYRIVSRTAQNEDALVVNFFGSEFFKRKDLEELLTVKNNIVELNFNRMPLKDEDLHLLKEMQHLQKLYLSHTQIKGDKLSELKDLDYLEVLSLAGNDLTDKAVEEIKEIKKLRELFLWNTQLTNDNIQSLEKALSTTVIDMGSIVADSVELKLPPPLIEPKDFVLHNQKQIQIKHSNKNAKIYYTVDGSLPDGHSNLYQDKISITKPLKLQSFAKLDEWDDSPVESKVFFPVSTFEQTITTELSSPTEPYLASGSETLFDNEVSNFNLQGKNFLAYKGKPFEMELQFANKSPGEITVNTFSMITSWVLPPERVEFWGKKRTGESLLVKEIEPTQPSKDYQMNLDRLFFHVNFGSDDFEKINIKIFPVDKLPDWHEGKGENAWIAVDEVFLYD